MLFVSLICFCFVSFDSVLFVGACCCLLVLYLCVFVCGLPWVVLLRCCVLLLFLLLLLVLLLIVMSVICCCAFLFGVCFCFC